MNDEKADEVNSSGYNEHVQVMAGIRLENVSCILRRKNAPDTADGPSNTDDRSDCLSGKQIGCQGKNGSGEALLQSEAHSDQKNCGSRAVSVGGEND